MNNESERLKAVDRFLPLKISRENELAEIARYAAELCYTSKAFISLIDKDTQHNMFSIGSATKSIRRENSLCNFTIEQEEVLVIPDLSRDMRSLSIPLKLMRGP